MRTILGLSDDLGLESVAEGVETAEPQAFLLEEGCQTLQGFLIARPNNPGRARPREPLGAGTLR